MRSAVKYLRHAPSAAKLFIVAQWELLNFKISANRKLLYGECNKMHRLVQPVKSTEVEPFNLRLPFVVWNLVVQFFRNPYTQTRVMVSFYTKKFLFFGTFLPLIPTCLRQLPPISIPAFLLWYWTFCYNFNEMHTLTHKLFALNS